MKRPTFIGGAAAALALALGASIVTASMLPLFGPGLTARLLIPALSLVYLLWLLARSETRSGRVTAVTLWALLAAFLFWFAPPLPAYLCAHAGAIWLLRSLYAYSGLLPALADLALTGFSVLGAVWALSRTGSVFMATWCFFLLQALWVLIPLTLRDSPPEANPDSRFERARQSAEAALRQLITH